MDVFGFALKCRQCRLYMQYKDRGLTVGLSEEFLPYLAILKNYRKYRQNSTSLNKVNSGKYI